MRTSLTLLFKHARHKAYLFGEQSTKKMVQNL